MATPVAPEYAFDSKVDHHLEVIAFHTIRTTNGIGHRLLTGERTRPSKRGQDAVRLRTFCADHRRELTSQFWNVQSDDRRRTR